MFQPIDPFRSGESITRGDVREHLNQFVDSHNDVTRRMGETALGTPPLSSLTVRVPASFWGKITGTSVCIGTHSTGGVRWHYNWTYMVRGTASWVAGTTNPWGALSGTMALNSIEANNGTAGVQGNSVNIGNTLFFGTGTAGFKLKEVQGNPVVRMWPELVADGTNTAQILYSFEYPNAVDASVCL